MLGTRNSARTAAVATAAAAVALAAFGPSGASSSGCTSNDGGISSSSCTSGRYVNPMRGSAWGAGRIDMGVDYWVTRRKAVRAIGRAKIMGSDSHSGWPGGHYIWYKLLRGDHRGVYIYVAETMTRLKRAGARVDAGQRIAIALPRGTGTEWGFANRHGEPRAAPCYSEGMRTHSGREMNRFLQSLGAPVQDKLRPGSDQPTGKRC